MVSLYLDGEKIGEVLATKHNANLIRLSRRMLQCF
jgi:hypothetical protein